MSWAVWVMKARPMIEGTMAGRPPMVVSASTRQSKREPMMERPTKASPTFNMPLACSTAMRAEQPVPQGERSILPGRMATALAPEGVPLSSVSGAANWQKEMCDQSLLVGCWKPSCWFAALTIFMPRSAKSLASSGLIAKPSAWASTMQKLSPP